MLQRQEVEVWYVLPAIRKELVEELLKRGVKKSDISKMLNITKASVSHYTKNNRGNEILLKGMRKDIKRGAERILKGECPTSIIQSLLIISLKKGITCQIHKQIDDVKERCNICNKLYKNVKVSL